jgi:hypothetical protein
MGISRLPDRNELPRGLTAEPTDREWIMQHA